MAEKPRPIDTSSLGPIRIDFSAEARRRERAEALLDRHSPPDVIAISDEERRRWVVDAMLRFADEEKRNV